MQRSAARETGLFHEFVPAEKGGKVGGVGGHGEGEVGVGVEHVLFTQREFLMFEPAAWGEVVGEFGREGGPVGDAAVDET